jgi:hypothetical protein
VAQRPCSIASSHPTLDSDRSNVSVLASAQGNVEGWQPRIITDDRVTRGKPVARRGRKATGLRSVSRVAGSTSRRRHDVRSHARNKGRSGVRHCVRCDCRRHTDAAGKAIGVADHADCGPAARSIGEPTHAAAGPDTRSFREPTHAAFRPDSRSFDAPNHFAAGTDRFATTEQRVPRPQPSNRCDSAHNQDRSSSTAAFDVVVGASGPAKQCGSVAMGTCCRRSGTSRFMRCLGHRLRSSGLVGEP